MIKHKKELIEIIKLGNDIKRIVNHWDPINLMNIAPDDEYESEIRAIRDEMIIEKSLGVEELREKINFIFKEFFYDIYKTDIEKEEEIAIEILRVRDKYNSINEISEYSRVNKDYDIKNLGLIIGIDKIIKQWDPLKILKKSLQNEYDFEVLKIFEVMNKNITEKELQEKINEIFKNSYNGLYRKWKYEEMKIAKKIKKVILEFYEKNENLQEIN